MLNRLRQARVFRGFALDVPIAILGILASIASSLLVGTSRLIPLWGYYLLMFATYATVALLVIGPLVFIAGTLARIVLGKADPTIPAVIKRYLSLIVCFATLFFVITLLADTYQRPLPLRGVAGVYSQVPGLKSWIHERYFDAGKIIPLYLDCLDFSATTATTLGYGDILPNTRYARLLADLEAVSGLLFGIVLVAIVISRKQLATREETNG